MTTKTTKYKLAYKISTRKICILVQEQTTTDRQTHGSPIKGKDSLFHTPNAKQTSSNQQANISHAQTEKKWIFDYTPHITELQIFKQYKIVVQPANRSTKPRLLLLLSFSWHGLFFTPSLSVLTQATRLVLVASRRSRRRGRGHVLWRMF